MHWYRLTMFILTVFFLSALVGKSVEDSIAPDRNVVDVMERNSVKLSCRYNSSSVNNAMLWYQQHPGISPQFLIMENYGVITPMDSTKWKLTHDKEKKLVDLEISSAEVPDSALYYCALRPAAAGNKLIFGSGTNLYVKSKEKSDPKYYTLKSKDDNTTACLATDFSTHNATHNSSLLWGDAIRAKGEKDYSQVALISKESKSLCPETNSEENTNEEWPFETDEKINFLSLTMLGLRILFLKTIVFNVIMTLRLCMS